MLSRGQVCLFLGWGFCVSLWGILIVPLFRLLSHLVLELYWLIYIPVLWLDTLVLRSFWSLLRSGSIGRICSSHVSSLLLNVLFVRLISLLLRSLLVWFSLLKILVDLLSTSLWILLLVYLLVVRVMIVFLPLLIVLVGLLSLSRVWLLWMLWSVVGCFLSIGFVYMECLVKLSVIGMLSFNLSFGRSYASCCSVGLQWVPPIILRLMV